MLTLHLIEDQTAFAQNYNSGKILEKKKCSILVLILFTKFLFLYKVAKYVTNQKRVKCRYDLSLQVEKMGHFWSNYGYFSNLPIVIPVSCHNSYNRYLTSTVLQQ